MNLPNNMYRFLTLSFRNTNLATRLTGLLAIATACFVASPATAADAGKPDASRAKVAMCIGCHGIPGYRASFPEVYSVPMISGQNDKYLQAALHAYAKGDRSHPTMNAIASSLSDQDIADLAAYYSNLK
jgi:cytochrome c553